MLLIAVPRQMTGEVVGDRVCGDGPRRVMVACLTLELVHGWRNEGNYLLSSSTDLKFWLRVV